MLASRKLSMTLMIALTLMMLSAMYLGAVDNPLEPSQDEQTASSSVLEKASELPTEGQSVVQEEEQCARQVTLDLVESEEILFDENTIDQTMKIELGLLCNCNSHGDCNDICGGPGVCHYNQCPGFYNGRCFCYPN